MISNERSWSSSYRLYKQQPKPAVPSEILKCKELEIERKRFVLMLKENLRGQFLSISESTRGGRDMIVVPTSGLEEFARVFAAMTQAANEIVPDDHPVDL
jgi:hypothetical protein